MSNSFFSFKKFTINQDRCSMKVGTDAVLLGAWAEAPETDSRAQRILDIGTGTHPNAMVTAIDIDGDAAQQARENAARSPFAGRIATAHCPIQQFTESDFDSIVCNPPYFNDSLKCPDPKRALSRHTDTLSYDELMKCAYRSLAQHGTFSLIIPADSLGAAETAAALAGLFLKRLCTVKTKAGKPAKRALLSYAKTPQADMERGEIIIGSSEYYALLKDFYL